MSKTEKQAYLRRKLQQNTEEATRFIKFLEDDDKGIEIENWTLDQLKSAVKEFRAESFDDDESVSSLEDGINQQVFGESEEESSSAEEEEDQGGFDVMDELTGGIEVEEEPK
jgi:23S rRNA maturation-related 3'-5' exoribonuclease YhaM